MMERRKRQPRQPQTPNAEREDLPPTKLTFQGDRCWRFREVLGMKNRERQVAQTLERNLVSAFFDYTLAEQVLHIGQRFIDQQLGVTPIHSFTRLTEFRG